MRFFKPRQPLMPEPTNALRLETAYLELLGRPIDEPGLRGWLAHISEGADVFDVIIQLAKSPEYINRVIAEQFALPDLKAAAPKRYSVELATNSGDKVNTYWADGTEAFDWIESQIIQHGYYNKPGVWSADMDADRQVLAAIVAATGSESVLEIGCGSGRVLHYLEKLGTVAYGVEISASAIGRASREIQDRIFAGSFDEADYPDEAFEVVCGFDVFEHITPERLQIWLEKIDRLLRPGGLVIANIPAFGRDEEFGEIFPRYLASWDACAEVGRPFDRLHVDDRGYPLHGHLIWAESSWWVRQFEANGLVRHTQFERPIHAALDGWFEAASPSRKSMFIFGKGLANVDDRVSEYSARLSVLTADIEALNAV